MEISVKILIEALKELPSFDIWEEDEFLYAWESIDADKCRLLAFRKNHRTKQWCLIV